MIYDSRVLPSFPVFSVGQRCCQRYTPDEPSCFFSSSHPFPEARYLRLAFFPQLFTTVLCSLRSVVPSPLTRCDRSLFPSAYEDRRARVFDNSLDHTGARPSLNGTLVFSSPHPLLSLHAQIQPIHQVRRASPPLSVVPPRYRIPFHSLSFSFLLPQPNALDAPG